MNTEYNNFLTVTLFTHKTILSISKSNEIHINPNHQIITCHNIDHNSLSSVHHIHIPSYIIRDFLSSIDYKLSYINCNCHCDTDVFQTKCMDTEIFNLAVKYNSIKNPTKNERSHARMLSLLVLSYFENSKDFISFLMRNTNPSLTFKVKEIITRDIGHNWSLESVANILCMSTSSLKKNLKTEGSTYRDIITQCRMQYAAKLLQTHNHLVTYQLASQCGYSHLSYFIHVFRKYYGVTPYQYSKKEIAA